MSKESIAFHVESDDYFATVATVLGLMRADLNNIKQNTRILKILEQDLMILQEGYRIIKKS